MLTLLAMTNHGSFNNLWQAVINGYIMMKEKKFYVYINTNGTHTVLYTGVTNNLLNRDDQHKRKLNKESFTAKYNINKVVYYETYKYIQDAINREKQIKAGSRQDKIDLIKSVNPGWINLIEDFYK